MWREKKNKRRKMMANNNIQRNPFNKMKKKKTENP